MKSLALGCQPDEVATLNERNRKEGCGVRYEPSGVAIIPDRGARAHAMRLDRIHDNNGGYGD
jgi:hypothetical protein